MRASGPAQLCLLASLTCALPAGAMVAGAGDGPSVALVGVEVHGQRDVVQQLEQAVRDGLSAKVPLVPPERVEAVRRELPSLFRRWDAPGELRRLGTELGARWLVRGRVDYDGASYAIELTVADAVSGAVLPARRDRCELCGWAELRARVQSMAEALGASDLLKPPPPPVSTPAAVGPGPEPQRGRSRSHRAIAVAKWSTLGLAVALLPTGAVLLALDGRPACEAPPGLRCPRSYDTALEGGLTLGVGIAAAIASGTLFLVDARRSRVIVPVLGVAPGGGLVGLAGSF